MVILITGGPSADVYTDASKPPITGLDLLQQPVQQLQDAEVAVYAVGVHEGITEEKKTFGEQLKLIASEPKDDHMIKVGDYSNLADVASKIAKKACIGKSRGPDDKRSSYLPRLPTKQRWSWEPQICHFFYGTRTQALCK